jgi:high-affinity iron transporter
MRVASWYDWVATVHRRLLQAVVASGVLAAVAAAADMAKGKLVYEQRCAPCHGSSGQGDGPAAAGLNPPPRDLRNPKFWEQRTTDQLRQVVTKGLPGSLMAPFGGVLSEAEIDDVVTYVESFRPAKP